MASLAQSLSLPLIYIIYHATHTWYGKKRLAHVIDPDLGPTFFPFLDFPQATTTTSVRPRVVAESFPFLILWYLPYILPPNFTLFVLTLDDAHAGHCCRCHWQVAINTLLARNLFSIQAEVTGSNPRYRSLQHHKIFYYICKITHIAFGSQFASQRKAARSQNERSSTAMWVCGHSSFFLLSAASYHARRRSSKVQYVTERERASISWGRNLLAHYAPYSFSSAADVHLSSIFLSALWGSRGLSCGADLLRIRGRSSQCVERGSEGMRSEKIR